MNQEKTDDIYRNIIKQAEKKGWTPNSKIEHIEWIVVEDSFIIKVAVWNGEQMTEQMGACSVERVIFDHGFAKIMWGEDFVDTLKEIVSKNSIERIEYLKSFYQEEGMVTNLD